jgi:hypothetical protein
MKQSEHSNDGVKQLANDSNQQQSFNNQIQNNSNIQQQNQLQQQQQQQQQLQQQQQMLINASKSATSVNNLAPNNQIPLQQQSFNIQHAQTVQTGMDVFKLLQQKQMQLNAELNQMQNRIVDLNCIMKHQQGMVSIPQQTAPLIGATSPPIQLQQQQHPQQTNYHHAHTVNDLDMFRTQYMIQQKQQKWHPQHQQHQQHHYMTMAPHNPINIKLANNGATAVHSIASAPILPTNRITSPPNHSLFQLNQPQQIVYQPVLQQEYSSLPDQFSSTAYYNPLDSASSSSSLTAQDILAAEQAQNSASKPTYASVVATASNTSAAPSTSSGLMTITENVVSGQMTHGQSSGTSMLPSLHTQIINRKLVVNLKSI